MIVFGINSEIFKGSDQKKVFFYEICLKKLEENFKMKKIFVVLISRRDVRAPNDPFLATPLLGTTKNDWKSHAEWLTNYCLILGENNNFYVAEKLIKDRGKLMF